MFSRPVVFLFAVFGFMQIGIAQELNTHKEKFSYTMGYQMGVSIVRGGPDFDLDNEIVLQGVKDALNSGESKLSAQDMDAVIAQQRSIMEQERQQSAATNLAKGEEFLEKNKQREGVVETNSGLQYEVIEEGEGAKPTGTDTVVAHYEGSLIDGSVFDSSYSRSNPATMPLNGVILGWSEGLQLMSIGSKYKFYIPAHLAYGEQGAGGRIGPNEALVFTVELIEIK